MLLLVGLVLQHDVNVEEKGLPPLLRCTGQKIQDIGIYIVGESPWLVTMVTRDVCVVGLVNCLQWTALWWWCGLVSRCRVMWFPRCLEWHLKPRSTWTWLVDGFCIALWQLWQKRIDIHASHESSTSPMQYKLCECESKCVWVCVSVYVGGWVDGWPMHVTPFTPCVRVLRPLYSNDLYYWSCSLSFSILCLHWIINCHSEFAASWPNYKLVANSVWRYI